MRDCFLFVPSLESIPRGKIQEQLGQLAQFKGYFDQVESKVRLVGRMPQCSGGLQWAVALR